MVIIIIFVQLTCPQTETRRLRRFPTFATSLVMNWPGQMSHYNDDDNHNMTKIIIIITRPRPALQIYQQQRKYDENPCERVNSNTIMNIAQ